MYLALQLNFQAKLQVFSTRFVLAVSDFALDCSDEAQCLFCLALHSISQMKLEVFSTWLRKWYFR